MSQDKELSKLGKLVKSARESHDLTQSELAQLLKTSQSAIARIEQGDQNVTLAFLAKLNKALDRKIITAAAPADDLKITGGQKLSGSVRTNTSKNGALHVMCAALLNTGTTTLHGVPRIEEIYRIMEYFRSIGIEVTWTGDHTLTIKPGKKITTETLDTSAAAKIRSGLMSIGSLAAHIKKFNLPHSGGCKMGERTISAHKYGLEQLGISIVTKETHYQITNGKPKSNRVVMYESSDTGTTNVLLAAARLKGVTTEIIFAQQNYMVMDVCYLLQKMGVDIQGMGSHRLTVTGCGPIHTDLEHHISEDPIETMFFVAAAIVTKSELTITHCPIDFLELELLKLETMGQKIERSEMYKSANGITNLVDITLYPSTLHALDEKIHSLPFPGINTDNLPFFVPIAAMAQGRTLIHDWMWEERAIYFTELNKLGAQVQLLDPHRVTVDGGTKLKANQIVCPPALRPSTIILIAMLGAEGTSILRNVYSIKRGYEDLVTRLNKLGARVESIQSVMG
jgi:UDP-N-acetylglucosamine 1-carboxyvinyltransferase